jgi:uncharacterized protein YdeI (BOF family)
MAKNPYNAANNSRISLNGTVVTAAATSFELDYGTGIITVEMDGWGWYTRSYPLLPGDQVTVYGRVDNDLYEVATIEAGSVYVKNLNTYFYANDLDEEDVIFYSTTIYPNTGFQLQGKIVDKNGREFTLDTGSKQIQIDTIQMAYNPLDDKGYQQLEKGDFVQVTGELDVDFFEETEIMAETVTTLRKDTLKKIK